MSQLINNSDENDIQDSIAGELTAAIDSPRKRALKKFGLAAISVIPWVGPLIVAGIELAGKSGKVDDLQSQWLESHRVKFQRLHETLRQIAERLENFGEEVDARLEDPKFLTLVEKAFQGWDRATTDEKRDYIRRLVANAAASSLCDDDLVRLFLDWIDRYDETHFNVIKAIYNQNGISRRSIWLKIHPTIPRDNSSEADLFKLLIHDLTLGHVIRQMRETTMTGQFVTKPRGGRKTASGTMQSPFDAEKPYELTQLGMQFVHYVMNEVAPQIGGKRGESRN